MGKNYTYSLYNSISPNRLFFIITITFLITVNITNPTLAQQKVSEIESYIAGIQDSKKALELESLIYDVQPTVYINDGAFDPIGQGSMTVASINAKEVGKLQEGHASLRSVKLLLIRFNNLQEFQAFRFQPAHIGNMPNLAYVFLSLGFDGGPIENFSGIQGYDESNIIFLFESAKPF